MPIRNQIFLAIETSCDETALAVLRRSSDTLEILSQVVASQVDIHAETGGVVPEVAAREHTKVLRPLLKKVLRDAQIQDPKKELEAIAVTVGPGLIPALVVGVTAAQTLAYAWNKPMVPVHHIEGHIYSALLESKAEMPNSQFLIPNSNTFPILALIVSGGHTLLIEMKKHLQYSILGQTRDDAAGEAFDKVARLLGLPYPGGPALSALAEKGDPTKYTFPRPMLAAKNFDFSFSGLKTAVYYTLREMPPALAAKEKAHLAASFQKAVVDTLVHKTKAAIEALHPKTTLLAGGVAANKLLRNELSQMVQNQNGELRIAPLNLCGDNAVMIGLVASLAYPAGRKKSWQEVTASARPPIQEFSIV